MAADKPDVQGDAAFAGIAHGSRASGVGNGHDDVGFGQCRGSVALADYAIPGLPNIRKRLIGSQFDGPFVVTFGFRVFPHKCESKPDFIGERVE